MTAVSTKSTVSSKGPPASSTGTSATLIPRLLKYLRPYTAAFVMSLFCMVFFGASDGAVPFLVKSILDGVFAEQNRALLSLLPIALVVFAVFRAITDFGQQYLTARIGHCIVRDIRNDYDRHLLKLSGDFFIRHPTGDLLSRMASDVVQLRSLLTDSFSAIIRDSIRIIALISAALYLDPWLALIAVTLFPVGVYPVIRFGKRIRRLSKRGNEGVGSLTAMLQESILGNAVVKIFGREEFEFERFAAENERMNATFIKSEKIRALTGPINEVLASLAISGVLLYGGYSVMNGTRSQGDFIAFLLSVFLLYDPFKRLTRLHTTVQQALSGAERIFEVLDAVSSVQDPREPLQLGTKNEIRFERVTFSYGGAENVAVSDVSFVVPEGRKVALVGFSGSGKSTLVSLVPRFTDPQAGKIFIGDVDISRVLLSDLRDRIALVGQHTFLFNDTVYNNIAYGKPGATRQEIEEAARSAFAFDFISQLPAGFETIVGEGGFALSGGERQRLAIARAILKDAPILILDEATASLDNRSEREVQRALDALTTSRTTMVVAHRLSTVQDADQIIVMSEGRIVEMGRHEELIGRGAEYAQLHALQFRNGEDEDRKEVLIN